MSGSTTTAAHQVNKANTTTALTADAPDPSVIGQSHAVTASGLNRNLSGIETNKYLSAASSP